jgi:ATP-dependent Zn protease
LAISEARRADRSLTFDDVASQFLNNDVEGEDLHRVAIHEAGHAVAVRLFMPTHRISRITIIRQGAAYGHVSFYPARDAYQGMQTRDQFMNRLRVFVAGKAAEIEFCGTQNQTLGVGGDFAAIRGWLGMMARAGMLGPLGGALRISVSAFGTSTSVSAEMAEAMEETFQRVLKETRKALRDNEHIMRALVAILMEKDEMLADEARAFFDQYGLHTPDPTMIKDGEEVVLNPRLPKGEEASTPAAQAGD